MPNLENDCRTEDVSIWIPKGVDEYNEPKLSKAESTLVRWEEGLRTDLTPDTSSEQVTVVLYTNQKLPAHSVICRCPIKELTEPLESLYQVIGNKEVPDIKGRHTEYTAHLISYKARLSI